MRSAYGENRDNQICKIFIEGQAGKKNLSQRRKS